MGRPLAWHGLVGLAVAACSRHWPLSVASESRASARMSEPDVMAAPDAAPVETGRVQQVYPDVWDAPVDPPSLLPPGLHVLVLPRISYVGEYGPEFLQDMAPGEPPSPAYPDGTVYVARRGPESEDPVIVTEWDLAHKKALRSLALPLPPEDTDVRMARSPNHLHLIVWRPRDEMTYVRTTTTLSIEVFERIGRVSRHRNDAIAADDSLAVISDEVAPDNAAKRSRRPRAEGEEEDDEQPTLVSFDATGRRVATRVLPKRYNVMADNLVVFDDAVYVLTFPDVAHWGALPKLLELRADLTLSRETTIHAPYAEIDDEQMPMFEELRLHSSGDHLLIQSVEPVLTIELNRSGEEIRRLPWTCPRHRDMRSPEAISARDLWFGGEHVSLEAGGRVRSWIAWVDAGFTEPRRSPCPSVNSPLH